MASVLDQLTYGLPQEDPFILASGDMPVQPPWSPWLDRATAQMKDDAAAYQSGGVPALLANTQVGQDLAGGFGGNTKSVGGRVTSAGLPDIRLLPRDEAIAIARGEPHLIPKEGGGYIGGPPQVNNYDDLLALRQKLDQRIAANPEGGTWYDRYRDAVRQVTGGDNPIDNDWMTKQHAQWSSGVSPESETQFTLKENNASLAGMPTKAYFPAQHEAHLEAIAQKDPNQYQLGQKTGEYARHNNPDQPGPPGATGVNDFRYQEEFGYPKTIGGGLTSSTIHKFMDYETALAVDRANKANLDGRSNWTGEQTQATPWVTQKAEALMKQRGISFEEAYAEANKQIGDFFDKHTFNATHEAFPGSEVFPQSVGSGNNVRAAYSNDPRSPWSFAPGGRDSMYAGMRIPGTGNAMRVRPSVDMQGMYTPPGATEPELNPGWSGRPLVAFETLPGGEKTIAKADRALLEGGEAYRAYIDGQNAGSGHINFRGGPVGKSNSLTVPMDRKATPDEMTAAQRLGSPFGIGDISDTGRGMTVTSFGPEADSNGLSKGLKGGLASDINAAIPGSGTVVRVKTDPVYVNYASDEKGPGPWKQGNDAATRHLLSYADRTPEIYNLLNNHPYAPQKAAGNMARDAEWAHVIGENPKLQFARSLIAQGPGGLDRLKANLGKGLLPALLGTAVLPSMLFSGREGQQ